jgi:hypothetical protein
MNRISFNSAAINSSGIRATIVYLPSVTATISRTLSERVSVQLRGSTAKSLDVTGDISKVFIIGSSPVSFGIAASGSLTKYQRVYFGSTPVTITITNSAILSNKRRLASGSSAKSFAVTGTMDPRVMLNASVAMQRNLNARLHSAIRMKAAPVAVTFKPEGTMTLTGGLKVQDQITLVPSGNLAKGVRNPFGAQVLTVTHAPTGDLRGLFRFKGTSQKAIATAGTVVLIRHMQGAVLSDISTDADLSNNAAIEDLKDFLMIRRETDREMTR